MKFVSDALKSISATARESYEDLVYPSKTAMTQAREKADGNIAIRMGREHHGTIMNITLTSYVASWFTDLAKTPTQFGLFASAATTDVALTIMREGLAMASAKKIQASMPKHTAADKVMPPAEKVGEGQEAEQDAAMVAKMQ